MDTTYCIIILILGIAIGAAVSELRYHAMRKDDERKADAAIEAANKRADDAEKELTVKQNIINSLSDKVARQQRTIDKYKKKQTI